MSEMITTTGRSSSNIATEIRSVYKQAGTVAYMAMVEMGRLLVEAKGLVDHGEWGSYVENEVGFSHSQANNYMRIYERSKTLTNSQTFVNLGFSHIVALLTLPDAQLEEFVENHDVQNMSVRKLNEEIREEKRLREAAEGQAADLQQRNETLKTEANTLRNKAEALLQEASRAKTSEEALTKKLERLEKKLSRAEQAEANARREADRLRENPEISDDMRHQLTAEAKAQAAAEARAEVQAELDAARAEVKRITEERAAAEQEKQKAEKLGDPEAMAFKLVSDNVVGMINQMEGLRQRASRRNPELEQKMRAFMRKMAERLNKLAEGRNDGVE